MKIILINSLLIISNFSLAANVSVSSNERTGLLTWSVEDTGLKLELIQLLPDFVRAIYAKHNFPKEEVERIAQYCFFGTILKNTSNKKLSYALKDWRYQVTSKVGEESSFPIKTKTQWLREWKNIGVNFSWTLLPDGAEFDIGDWQQGFLAVPLSRNQEFNLFYQWSLDGRTHAGLLEKVKCSPDDVTVKESGL